MLSYQHGYHAGGFADVLKHVILTQIMQYLIQKDKPLFYLETHSGRGIYRLHDKQALKTGEAREGIELLWQKKEILPEVFSQFINILTIFNPDHALQIYPGSPAIALETLRPKDRLVCCELHPREYEMLIQLAKQQKRVSYGHEDGIKKMLALLPPPERRGLIFIDPSYEIKTEYRDIPKAMQKAYQRFETGVYCLWYPLIDRKLHEQLLRGLAAISDRSLQIELHLNQPHKQGMQGCGLWVINPPHKLKSEAKIVLETLQKMFNPGQSTYLIHGDYE